MDITITLNGKKRSVPSGTTVTSMLRLFNLDANSVVVEINQNGIEKNTFDTHTINDGDKMEILEFVGGG